MGNSQFDDHGYKKTHIPTCQQMYKPILLYLAQKEFCLHNQIYDYVVKYFNLTEADLLVTSDNGRKSIFYLRFNCALRTLNNKCLIQRMYRGGYLHSCLGDWCVEQYSNYDLMDISWIPNFLIDKYGHYCPDVIAEERWWSFLDSLGLFEDEEILYDGQEYLDPGYIINIDELFELYKSDYYLRERLKTGRYAYYKGYLARACLTLDENEEKNTLVWIVGRNSNEYLGFTKSRETGRIRYSGVLSRGHRFGKRYLSYKISCFRHPWGEYDDPYTRKRIDFWIESMPEEAHDAITYLMEECKVKREWLAGVLEVTPRTILRWRTGETPMKLENLIAICLALQLPSKISFILIEKFYAKDADGEYFQPDTNEKHLFWEMLLDSFYMDKPKELNNICKKKGYDIFFTESSVAYAEYPRHEYTRENKY